MLRENNQWRIWHAISSNQARRSAVAYAADVETASMAAVLSRRNGGA